MPHSHFLLLILKEGLTELPRLALNSLHNPDRPCTYVTLASVPQTAGTTGLYHRACSWLLLRDVPLPTPQTPQAPALLLLLRTLCPVRDCCWRRPRQQPPRQLSSGRPAGTAQKEGFLSCRRQPGTSSSPLVNCNWLLRVTFHSRTFICTYKAPVGISLLSRSANGDPIELLS